MSSCKVENLSQIADAILPGPEGPGLLAWLGINSENKLDFNWYLVKLLLEGQKFKIKSQIQLDF